MLQKVVERFSADEEAAQGKKNHDGLMTEARCKVEYLYEATHLHAGLLEVVK